MRLADRLFAFRRPPAWSDAVQVLLWALGWVVVAGALASTALALAGFAVFLGVGGFPGGSRTFAATALAVSVSTMLVYVVGGSWFVSEAYRGWRTGHPHGRQWTILIAGILLMGVFGLAMAWRRPAPVQAAFFAVEVGFGLALLVACLTTKPPVAEATTPA